MRRIILAAASIAALGGATTAYANDHDSVSRRELNKDADNVAKQREDLQDAQMYGDRHDVKRETKQLHKAQTELRQDRRDAYRAGVYTRPAGWRDHSWAMGERLPASYYGETYWVEPARYGLAPVGRGERWVRVDRDVVRIAPDGTVREVRRGWFY